MPIISMGEADGGNQYWLCTACSSIWTNLRASVGHVCHRPVPDYRSPSGIRLASPEQSGSADPLE